jgi:hypothetical protein
MSNGVTLRGVEARRRTKRHSFAQSDGNGLNHVAGIAESKTDGLNFESPSTHSTRESNASTHAHHVVAACAGLVVVKRPVRRPSPPAAL